jgi:hypothetical protein
LWRGFRMKKSASPEVRQAFKAWWKRNRHKCESLDPKDAAWEAWVQQTGYYGSILKGAELVSDVIEVDTPYGKAEAIRRKGYGHPWMISYPWGSDGFFGSSGEVRRHMTRAVRESIRKPKD